VSRDGDRRLHAEDGLGGKDQAGPSAALIMVPIIAKEGIDGVKGKAGCDTCQYRFSVHSSM
jgi:hypothetical protein